MKAWTVWQEICWLLYVDEMSPTIQESFESIKGEVEALLREASSGYSLPHDTTIDALNRELQTFVDGNADSYHQGLSREATRRTMLAERCERLETDLMASNPTPQSVRTLERLDKFLTRFQRFRVKLMAQRHLPPHLAEQVAFAVDSAPDPRLLQEKVAELRGLSEQNMVAGLLSGMPPTIFQHDSTVIIFHARWTCRLEYGTEDNANAAIALVKSRYAQNKLPSNSLRAKPTVANLFRFLARALPGVELPHAISIDTR